MGLLAEQVDRQVSTTELPQESISAMILRTFRREIHKTWDWLWRTVLVALLVLVLWLIPVINIAVPVVWFLWSGWILGLIYFDYGAEFRQVPLRSMKAAASRRPLL